MIVTVSIDVEPDCSPDWRYASPLTFRGVTVGIARILHPLFQRHGVRPTYLLNNVVLNDPESVEVMRGLSGSCELGTHLHPEFIGPHQEIPDPAGMKGAANQCELPPLLEEAKLSSITRLFAGAFGFPPTSFRAGRFSAGGNTIASLMKNGYTVDSSVTPHVLWQDQTRAHPVDFRGAPDQPYYAGTSDITATDESTGILEIPVSIVRLRRLWRIRTQWLRPSLATSRELLDTAQRIVRAHRGGRPVVLNMMFHNVEILPALSPYCLTAEDCDEFVARLNAFFSSMHRESAEFLTMSEVYARYSASGR